MSHGRERPGVVRVADQPGYFVLFVRDDRLAQEGFQRHVCQLHLRAGAFLRAGGSQARELIAGPSRDAFAISSRSSIEISGRNQLPEWPPYHA